jgi:hypothetical protein
VSGVLAGERVLEGTSAEGIVLTEEQVLDGTSDEGKVLDGIGDDKGDSMGVKGSKDRYWVRFLKGMVTDRNRSPSLLSIIIATLSPL